MYAFIAFKQDLHKVKIYHTVTTSDRFDGIQPTLSTDAASDQMLEGGRGKVPDKS